MVYDNNRLDTKDLQPVTISEDVRNMRGQFSQTEQQEWIHILEFKAVFNALTALGDHLNGVCVRLWCDNRTVVSCYNKGFSPKADIRHWLKAINQLL